LLSYDYSKTADPLQPWSSHITSLLAREVPKTSDIELVAASESLGLHKFILSARSPYFREKFSKAPEVSTWKLAHGIPVEALRLVTRYLYLGELPRDIVGPSSSVSEEDVAKGIDKLCKQLEIDKLWEAVLSMNDRRLARQRHQDEVQRARDQVETFLQDTVLKHKIVADTRKVGEIKWPHDNAIFANCLLRADEEDGDDDDEHADTGSNSIPVGPTAAVPGDAKGAQKKHRRSVLYPVHKAFLIRSPYFETMFSSQFLEAQDSEFLHIIKVDCVPEVLEIILRFMYTEKTDCPLELALDLLYTSDMLLLDKLKAKAAVTISTLGSGNSNALVDRTHSGAVEARAVNGDDEGEPLDIYEVIRAAWDLGVQRLEEFAARYMATRLEDYIDEPEFADLIQESASRIKERQETDTIELLDDIRYYLSERFRLRFEGDGMEEMMDETGELDAEAVEALAVIAEEAAIAQGAVSSSTTITTTTSDGDEAARKADGDGAGQGELVEGEGAVRTLDGELVEDEFVSDALNYQILLRKIDTMLERLKLDA
jgi:ankyrin repeat/BTB/POZ domain-containing protein 1